ncbi:alpha/beta hydrolase-fold protein [Pseudoflavitalea rhizosphaerae]|uniref:alpha/beta hydrolase-fold protein n=1 Tax=Pseudoflavitalea rhizosphaerae TaxID=1884793 RepID=UPI001F495F02|nr:alpha/beta hydrolase-fold protein [Pseudoflavitalea rhizosphaerae]
MKNTLLLCAAVLACSCLSVSAQQIRVIYTGNAAEKFSGNVFLYLSKENKEPKSGYVGLTAFPLYRISVKDVKPGQAVVFNDAAVSYPVKLSDLERGEYYAQAVWDRNTGDHLVAETIGNNYSKPSKFNFTKKTDAFFSLVCTEVVKEKDFVETDYSKELKVESKLLSDFHKKPVSLKVAVMLPAAYLKEPGRKFPVLYYVSGFGGDYRRMSGYKNPESFMDTVPFIRVVLDGNCPTGHSVYANSANNGPWGDAMVKELIPAVETNFRCDGGRVLMGHSSGGWTVLWLQTQYPSVFAGTWSSAPDPVDFRNFTGVDIYNDKNLYYEKDSSLRWVATVAGRFPWISMKQMVRMEHVMNRGEQMQSFNAVFSQRNADGSPRPLVNASTGEIDPVTVDHWKQYDICRFLKSNWSKVKADLQGKVRISTGEQDNFMLNQAVHLMEKETGDLDTGFEYGYYPGDHFTVFTKEYQSAGVKFLLDHYAAFRNK